MDPAVIDGYVVGYSRRLLDRPTRFGQKYRVILFVNDGSPTDIPISCLTFGPQVELLINGKHYPVARGDHVRLTYTQKDGFNNLSWKQSTIVV